MTEPDAFLFILAAIIIWIGAGAVMNAILARIFGWKKDQS